jgi:hypothetical protein
MKTLFLVLIITLSLLIGCSKDNSEPASKDTITISGITARNDIGAPTGTIDETDWTYDSYFPSVVNTLLNFTDTLNYSNALSGANEITAFPNPSDNNFAFHCTSTNETVIKYIIVDESLNVYAKRTMNISPGSHVQLILTEHPFQQNTYYRMYYAFYDKNKNVYYKGHGDLKKN